MKGGLCGGDGAVYGGAWGLTDALPQLSKTKPRHGETIPVY